LIKDQSPDILFISETKISPQVLATLNKLGFFLISQVATFGSSGGLALAWRKEWNLNVLLLAKTISQHGVFLTLPTLFGFSHVYMDLPTEEIEELF
jgi:hypothetical protein